MAENTFGPRSGFNGLLVPAEVADAGVIVREFDGCGIATVLAKRGLRAALREAVGRHYGLSLPDRPRVAGSGDLCFVATGPDAWLAFHTAQSYQFAARLLEDIGGAAAVCDQSDGYAVLGLKGPKVRNVLAKGFAIDLHPTKFGPGAAAVTTAAHIRAILWRPTLANDSAFDFGLAVYRSYAESFLQWLVESATEYGLAIYGPQFPK